MKAKIIEYSSNKVRKTQNEHLIIVCQNLIGLYIVVNLSKFRIFFWFFISRNYGSY